MNDNQDYDAVSKWHFEAEINDLRGMVSMAEQDGVTALRVKFADGDTEIATMALTLAQAEFLIDVLPAALNVVRSRQERRAWESSLYDPFADICEGGSDKAASSQADPRQPSSKSLAKTTAQKTSATGDADGGGATDDMPEAELPIPARRGAARPGRRRKKRSWPMATAKGKA